MMADRTREDSLKDLRGGLFGRFMSDHPADKYTDEYKSSDHFKDWADKNGYDIEIDDFKDHQAPDEFDYPDTRDWSPDAKDGRDGQGD